MMQLDLGLGLPPPPKPPPPPERERKPHLLFLAAIPPRAVAAHVWSLAIRFKYQQRLLEQVLAEENLHATVMGLAAFDELTDDCIAQALSIGARISASPFELIFDRIESFEIKKSNKHPLMLVGDRGVEPFRLLQGAAWTAAGLQSPMSAPRPHMTLMWAKRLLPPMLLEEPISFAVEEIVLVHSHYGLGYHQHLGRWRLKG
jgi:RNA 2',3'-cyclic 3'-phosphodiesterase